MIPIARLMREEHGRCYYCGHEVFYSILPGKRNHRFFATRDHKRPVSRGGSDSRDNIVLSCLGCNTAKANRTDIEFEYDRRILEQARLDAEWAEKHPEQSRPREALR